MTAAVAGRITATRTTDGSAVGAGVGVVTGTTAVTGGTASGSGGTTGDTRRTVAVHSSSSGSRTDQGVGKGLCCASGRASCIYI